MLGLAYLGLLKVHRFGTSGRYYVVVPPVPVVRNIAGRRVSFVAEVVAESCQDKHLSGLLVSFRATVTPVRRSDGEYWYRLALSTRYSDLWRRIADCGYVRLYLSLA